MKNKIWLFLLVLVLIIPCTVAFVGCGNDDDGGNGGNGGGGSSENGYDVTISSNAAYNLTWNGGFQEETHGDDIITFEGVDANSAVDFTLHLYPGYGVYDMVVTVNGTPITPLSHTDIEYIFRPNIYVNADMTISITGIDIARYNITLPDSTTWPSEINSMAISKILKKGTTEPVAYTGQTINYEDSICIKVTTNNNKALMGGSSISAVGLKYLDEGIGNTRNYIYPTITDVYNEFEYYIKEIRRDYDFIAFENTGAEETLIFPNVELKVEVEYLSNGYSIQSYDLTTHQLVDIPGNYTTVVYGETYTFAVYDQSWGVLDFTNSEILVNGRVAVLKYGFDDKGTPQNDDDVKYIQIENVTEDIAISVSGIEFDENYLETNNKKVFYITCNDDGLYKDSIANSAYFIDNQGRYACLAERDAYFSASANVGWKILNRTISANGNTLSGIVSTEEFGYGTVPFSSQGLLATVMHGVEGYTGYWVIQYEIYTFDTEGNQINLVNPTTISTGVAITEELVIDVDYQMQKEIVQLDMQNLIHASNDDIGTPSELSGVTFSYSESIKTLTLTKGDIVIKITNMYKISDNYNGNDADDTYGLQTHVNSEIYCSHEIGYGRDYIGIKLFNNTSDWETAAWIGGMLNNWGQSEKTGNFYYTDITSIEEFGTYTLLLDWLA